MRALSCKPPSASDHRFWHVGLAIVLLIAAIPLLLTHRFSLPYIDHPDEPSPYYKALQYRGLFDLPGWEGYPPAYIGVNMLTQIVGEALGVPRKITPTIAILRFMAVLATLLTLVLIAWTARLLAGDLAGLVAGAAWGLSPTILGGGVYATPDPPAALCAMLALWLAVMALQADSGYWPVASFAAGLLATLFKYTLAPALLPGVVAALWVTVRARRRGLWYLVLQSALLGIVCLWLWFGYHVAQVATNSGPDETAAIQSVRNPANFFHLATLADNVLSTIVPINATVFSVVVVLGGAACLTGRRTDWQRFQVVGLGLCVYFFLALPWLISVYGKVSQNGRLRDIVPAVGAACICFGVATEQIAATLATVKLPRAATVLPLVLFVFLPNLSAEGDLTAVRLRGDSRVLLRAWADASLEPGVFLVTSANHKTFNPYFGGLEGRKWFNWWVVPDIRANPLPIWRDQYKIEYAAIPLDQWRDMQTSADTKRYLEQMLHLKDFVAPPALNGPEVIVYRLWRMGVETHDTFDQTIHLVGYDRTTDRVAPGDILTIRLYWQADQTPKIDFSVYLHLSAMDTHTVLAQADGEPASPERPTASWNDPNETLVSDRFQISVPAKLPVGDYRVLLGLYDSATGQKLTTAGQQDYVVLFTLHVTKSQGASP